MLFSRGVSRVFHRSIHQTPVWSSANKVVRAWNVEPEYKVPKDFQRMREITQEGVRAHTALKLAKHDPNKVDDFLKKNTPRMLKKDMLCLFYLLRKHGEAELAVKIFDVIKKETWFEPNFCMYWEMSLVYLQARKMEEVWNLMDEMESKGVALRADMLTGAIRCCLEDSDFERFERFYKRMMNTPSIELSMIFLTGLRTKLRGVSKLELAEQVENDMLCLRKNRREISPPQLEEET